MIDEAPQASPASAGPGSLAEFTLNLAKAMLRTGYYAPDHPEAKQSLEGLHVQFRRTVGDDSALTYLVGKTEDAETVMLQAHGEAPQPLGRIMISGMAELFAPKLLDFFHRRRLVSFSLRSSIGAEELSAFVILMSEPPKAGRVEEERERVEKIFVDQHIINVSTVFESDILGRKRNLPWRVELALSRLGRDLRMLPLFQKASPEEVQRVKIQILDDLVRPLQAPGLVKDFLLNCDLLAADMEVLRSAQVEREIIAQVPPDRLAATCRVIADEMEEAPQDGLEGRRRLILRHVLGGLLNADVELDGELVEACVKHHASTFEELPKKVRAQVRRRRAVDTFLVREDEYLEALGHIPSGEKGAQLANTGEILFSELLKRESYVHAAGILEAVRTGNQEGESAAAARAVVDKLREIVSEEETVRAIVQNLKEAERDKALSGALIELVTLAGRPAAEDLRALYRESESVPVRAHAFDAIKGIGAPALIPFLDHLAETENEWPAIHHILKALAGVRDPLLARPIRPFLEHENAHVRQSALARIFEIEGDAAEAQLLESLRDEDPAVRHMAVAYLGRLPSPPPKALAFFTSALKPTPDSTSPETSDEVLVEVCRSLVSIAEASPEHAAGFEQTLLRALTLSDQGGLLGRLRKATPHFSEHVRVAICEALGAMGTQTSREGLETMGEGEDAVAQAARAAVKEILGENGA